MGSATQGATREISQHTNPDGSRSVGRVAISSKGGATSVEEKTSRDGKVERGVVIDFPSRGLSIEFTSHPGRRR